METEVWILGRTGRAGPAIAAELARRGLAPILVGRQGAPQRCSPLNRQRPRLEHPCGIRNTTLAKNSVPRIREIDTGFRSCAAG